jgi:hypothetical protein
VRQNGTSLNASGVSDDSRATGATMTLTDDEGNTISESDAIKTGMDILINCKTDDDSDFSKGLLAVRKLIKAHSQKRMEP